MPKDNIYIERERDLRRCSSVLNKMFVLAGYGEWVKECRINKTKLLSFGKLYNKQTENMLRQQKWKSVAG